EADARGRGGLEDQPYPQAQRLLMALQAARAVGVEDLPARESLQGPAIGAALAAARIAAIRAALGNPQS
ncbi:MAG TPA: multifunctional CCA tRNA nucleotidyl transferase/2'3'-cyclic phosphodiesterase/2'nucleotidase/phosphatase, partial [Gammaproteobacteria bacterium]|nr:multifunctional CCA tRNA nucleotidyl transferase/2'3'-cyclic phosphodiesterase/2'nucleotidase/phosphatase [Gammaproteobacteria bacterium]